MNSTIGSFRWTSRDGGAMHFTISSFCLTGRDSSAMDNSIGLFFLVAGGGFGEIGHTGGFADFLRKFDGFCLGRWEERVREGSI